MSQPIDINEDFMDLKSFAKRPIFMRQVSADMLSLISYKTAKNNQLIKQSSKYFKELNVSSLMKGSNGSLNKQGWVTVRKITVFNGTLIFYLNKIQAFFLRNYNRF